MTHLRSTDTVPYGSVTGAMLKVLEDGPATANEICSAINRDRYQVSAVISRLRRAGVNTPKRIYVMDWATDHSGERMYPRPVYALGDKPDKKKPKVDRAAAARRWRATRNKAVNSVFALGTNTKTRRSTSAILKGVKHEVHTV